MALTDEQKRLRTTGFGASEAATLVGVGPGKLIELWESKVNPRAEENLDDMLPAELGTLLEEPVCRVYARRTGTFLANVETLRHPTKPLALATPDRARFTTEAARDAVANDSPIRSIEALEGADRLVEAKTHAARYRHDYGSEGTGQVPEHEAIQATWQMGVTGKRVVDLPVLFRGDWGVEIKVYTIAFNATLFEWLYEAAERFWADHVLARKPPRPDGTDRYDEALARMFPADRQPPAAADAEDERLMLDYAKFREVERRAELLKKKAGQRLKARIGEAGGLFSPTLGKLSWTRSKDSTEVDWQKAAQDALLLAGQCLNGFDRLRDVGEHLSPENRAQLEARLKAIVPEATKVRSGYRSLRLYPKGPAALELAQLQIAMDALEDGT